MIDVEVKAISNAISCQEKSDLSADGIVVRIDEIALRQLLLRRPCGGGGGRRPDVGKGPAEGDSVPYVVATTSPLEVLRRFV